MAGTEWYQPDHPADTPPDVQLDTTVPHIARIYDYWLGGKDNFAVDRAAGQRAMDANPSLYQGVKGNRAFLARSVRYLAGQQGIRQFLDIGTGIPTANNTHEVAQSVAADSRVVYVDNDHSKSGCAHSRLGCSCCLKRTRESGPVPSSV